MHYLKIVSGIILCIAVMVALTFGVNTAFRHEEPLVYVTSSGIKYHSADCGYLWSSAVPMGQYQAKRNGYTACLRCGGTPSGAITVNGYALSFCISAVSMGTLAFVCFVIYAVKKK